MAIAKPDAGVDPTTWPADWRADWEVREDGNQLPCAWHRSGLCFVFEFEPADESGNWVWVVYDDDISLSRLHELRAEMGEDAFFQFCTQLGQQAKARWHELGHADFKLAQ